MQTRHFTHSAKASRRMLVLGGLAVAVLVGVFFLVRWQRPNLFDFEQANASELAALQKAPLIVAPSAQTDDGWPQWFGPHRDGRAPTGSLRTDWVSQPPVKVWSVPCGGGYSSLAVVGGRVYTQDRTGSTDRLLCLDAATGRVLWTQESERDYRGIGYGSGPRATPTVKNGHVYTLSGNGVLSSVAPPPDGETSGKVVWSVSLPTKFQATVPGWGFASSPLIEGDAVIVQAGGSDGSVVAFDAKTGSVKWTAGTEPNGYSSPIAATIAEVRQIIAVTGNTILGIRATDGEVLWRHSWETAHHGNIAAPVVVGDYVFVSSNYGKGCVLLHLKPTDGGVKPDVVYFRKGRVMMNHHSTSVHRDGYLYGFDMNTLRCVDLRTGEIEDDWVARDSGGTAIPKGSLILVDQHLLGLTESGTLFLADANPKEFRFCGKLDRVLSGNSNWSVPAFVDGRIYLRDEEKIVCLDASANEKK